MSNQLVELLKSRQYSKGSSNFWYPIDPEFIYELPHVAWKAHLAAASLRQAVDVVGNSIPILEALGVQHKVDTDPGVFRGTEKLVTI